VTKRERELLQHAMQVLVPISTSECDGCNYEINEAIKCLRLVGIEYKYRKPHAKPKHSKAAERREGAPSIALVQVPVKLRRGRLVVDTDRLPARRDDLLNGAGLIR
jgi:hypothetical protein